VREAKQKADLVVFTIHAHESPTGMDDDTPAPPDFLIKLFHDAVDAGADEIIGGGPHSLRGVEIYKGRPILYGMGLFLLRPEIMAMQETVFRKFPDIGIEAEPERSSSPPIWYDGVVAVTDFDAGRAKLVRLYPIDLANSTEAGRRGVPHLAEQEKARRILGTLQKESAQFGTKISIEDSVGVILIP
jgi:poly-gamma-glutamate synthesis protein (capsule biosynthesis protein)